MLISLIVLPLCGAACVVADDGLLAFLDALRKGATIEKGMAALIAHNGSVGMSMSAVLPAPE